MDIDLTFGIDPRLKPTPLTVARTRPGAMVTKVLGLTPRGASLSAVESMLEAYSDDEQQTFVAEMIRMEFLEVRVVGERTVLRATDDGRNVYRSAVRP